jgi:hypothetical protein
MGMWSGIMQLARMLFSALLIFLSGVTWDNLGPHYVFIALIALNVLRIPLLMGMPETLGTQYNSKPGNPESQAD